MKQKEAAKNAVKTAWNFLYEVETLRDVASYIARVHEDGDCEEIDRQVEVLNNIADERIHSALEALDVVDDYFLEKPLTKKNIENTQPVRQELKVAAAVASGKIQ